MKKLAIIVAGIMLMFSSAFAQGFVNKGKVGNISVEISSQKPLSVGDNNFVIKLFKGDKPLNNAKVTFKVFMPEMPGMPAMEHSDEAKFKKDGVYSSMLGFCMSGTWQINILIETQDGKKARYKSSLIF